MYCTSCGKLIPDGAQFCGACGNPAAGNNPTLTVERRPIAAIAVGAIVGIVGLLWSIGATFKALYSDPAGVEGALYQAFPALHVVTLFWSSLGMLGWSALLIGVLLVFQRHPKGRKTVRLTSYCMLAAILMMFVASYFAFTGAVAWRTLDAQTKGSLIGGLSGGVIGGIFQWGLILFLFRKSP